MLEVEEVEGVSGESRVTRAIPRTAHMWRSRHSPPQVCVALATLAFAPLGGLSGIRDERAGAGGLLERRAARDELSA